jgi:hypothetical protein
MEDNKNNINAKKSNDKKIVAVLQKKVSTLRTFVYIFLAISVLMTCLAVFWIYNSYSESLIETYYSTAPPKPVAYLYLSPLKGNYKIGEEFTINVLINTVGSNVNAVAAYLSYNKNKIKAISIDISDSVFNIPIEQVINEKDGKIKVGLAKPTPGINTYNGKVAILHFKALSKTASDVENVYFDFAKDSDLYSGAFLNDKKGTNILKSTRGAQIFID